MRCAPLLGAALLVVASACERASGPAGPTVLEQLPPLAPVAGLPGFESRSRLVYHAAPEVLHLLEATYLFPARVRWSRSVVADGPAERVLSYRHGEHMFTVPERSSTSHELAGRERATLMRSMELRRALFLWPDGCDWRGRGEVRRADLGALGTLQARLDGDGRPRELASLDPEGVLLESFTAITWQELRGRVFPASMELSYRREPIWVETVERVVTDVGFVDEHFLPLDRRPPGTRPSTSLQQRLALPPATLRSIALVSDGGWEALLDEARRLQADEALRLAAAGFELAPEIVLGVDPSGRPTHVQVRLLPFPGPPPPGYEPRAAGPAQVRFLDHPIEIGPALAELGPAAGGSAWVILRPDEPDAGGALQLVVPGAPDTPEPPRAGGD